MVLRYWRQSLFHDCICAIRQPNYALLLFHGRYVVFVGRGVAFNLYVKEVKDCIPMGMKRLQSEWLSIAQTTIIPSVADFLESKPLLLYERVQQPDVSVKCSAYHVYR